MDYKPRRSPVSRSVQDIFVRHRLCERAAYKMTVERKRAGSFPFNGGLAKITNNYGHPLIVEVNWLLDNDYPSVEGLK